MWEPVSFLPPTLSNPNRYAKFFHYLKEEKIPITITKYNAFNMLLLPPLCEITDTDSNMMQIWKKMKRECIDL